MPTPFILTNHPGSDRSETWAKVAYQFVPDRTTPWPIINRFLHAWSLFHIRSEYKAVVLGGDSRVDTFYLILQRLWPFKLKPIIKNECLWYRSSPVKHFFKKLLFRWLDKIIKYYIVYARCEIDDFSRVFGLPRNKFIFIPYHTTIDDKNIHMITHGDYLFSGGNSDRDYHTLAKALEGIDLKAVIACSDSNLLANIKFSPNVKTGSVSQKQFRRLIAESGINVVALKKGLLRSSGHQTFLNSMAMGKPVIVTDPKSAKDYIMDGIDGILVPPGDAASLRDAILKLHNNPDLATKIGLAAKKKAMKLDTEAHLSTTVQLVMKAIDSH